MPIKKNKQQTEGVCLEINHLRTYMADPKTNTHRDSWTHPVLFHSFPAEGTRYNMGCFLATD